MESKTISFDFYYGKEAEQFSFYRIPKTLFTNPAFSKLSSDAKILYGLMLDRLGLSIKNGWKDNEERHEKDIITYPDDCIFIDHIMSKLV